MSIPVSRQATLRGPDRRPRVAIDDCLYLPKTMVPACAVGVARGVLLDPPAGRGAAAVLICQYEDPEDGRGCDDPRYLGLSCSCARGLAGAPCAHLAAAVAHGLVRPGRRPPKRQRGLWREWTDLALFFPSEAAASVEGGGA